MDHCCLVGSTTKTHNFKNNLIAACYFHGRHKAEWKQPHDIKQPQLPVFLIFIIWSLEAAKLRNNKYLKMSLINLIMANFAVWLTIKMSKGKIAQFITTSVLFFVDIATTTSTGARTDLILVKFSNLLYLGFK